MLSYRHAFHAGSHADVFKHVLLIALLQRLLAKATPLRYIETHAGAGGYSLESAAALKVREYEGGVGRLWQSTDAPPPVRAWLELVQRYNGGATALAGYPGSPWFARQCLRPIDNAWLYELHPADHAALAANCRADRRVKVLREDGLAGAIGLVPPPARRALLLIDPSYEVKHEYRKVAEALDKAYRRFATGVYAIWYPVIERRRADAFERSLRATGIRPLAFYELAIAPDAPGHGMTASAMAVVNPPWQLHEDMQVALPWLAEKLGREGAGRHRIETLAPA